MRKALVCIFFMLLISVALPSRAEASGYDSWVRNKESGNTTIDGVGVAPGGTAYQQMPEPSEDPVGSIQEKISETLMEINLPLGKVFKLGAVDASVTGIIMGHLTNSSGTSFFVFDLSDNNLYGVIGATIYVALRTLALAFLFIFVLAKLIVTLYESDMKGLADMKEVVYGAIIVFFLLFIMPQVVDWVCTARNAIASYLYEKIQGMQVTTPEKKDLYVVVPGVNITVKIDDVLNMSGMELTYYEMWENHKSILNAVIYFAAVVALPLVWIASYMRIAITQTVLFGVYPAFAVLSIRDRNLSSKWAMHFFTNAFVPVLDLMLIFIPSLIIQAIDSGDLVGAMLKAIIVCLCFASIVPIRNQILSALGNQFGVRPSIGGAIALGAAAAGALREIGSNGSAALGSLLDAGKSDERSSVPEEPENSMSDMVKPLEPVESPQAAAFKEGTLEDVPPYTAINEDDKNEIDSFFDQFENAETEANAEQAEEAADMAIEMDDPSEWMDAAAVEISDLPESSGTEEAPEVATASMAEEVPEETVMPMPEAAPEIPDEPDDMTNPMIEDINRDIYRQNPDFRDNIHSADEVIQKAVEDEAKGNVSFLSDERKAVRGGKEFDKALNDLNSKRRDLHYDREDGKTATEELPKYNAALETFKNTGIMPQGIKNLGISNQEGLEREMRYLSKDMEREKAAEINYPMGQHSLKLQYAKAFNSIGMGSEYIKADDLAKAMRSQGYAAYQYAPGYEERKSSSPYSSPSYSAPDPRVIELDRRRARAAEYKDFNPDEVKGYLSPEERQQFERNEALKYGGKVAMAAGKFAAAAALTYVSSVGGEDAMHQVANKVFR